MSQSSTQQNIKQAWVVFSSQTDLPWLKILKPGFRHCFVLLNDGHNWISVDPLSNYTDVLVHHVPVHFDMPLWLRDQGYQVVASDIQRIKKSAPWAPYTCVEAVKRVLGLHKRFILTPWQLYCHLTKTNSHPSSRTAKLEGSSKQLPGPSSLCSSG